MSSQHSPQRILLATDLSARCDRALDRAAQLAEEWQAELLALNVLEPTQAPDMALTWAYGDEEVNLQIAERQLKKDLASVSVKLKARIAHGEPSNVIGTLAMEEGSHLVVTGIARSETLGRFLLGSTVEKLAQNLAQPLLVVRNRVHGAYQKIVVATDFSESASHALQVALKFFPQHQLYLYHAHNTPFAHAKDDKHLINDVGMKQVFEDWLSGINLPAGARARLHCVAEMGALEKTLTQYVRSQDIDLVIMGAYGEGSFLSALLGSSAERLFDWLPCDTLSVRRQPSTD